MKLATFNDGRSPGIGIVVGDEIVDLASAAPDLPRDMLGFLEQGEPAMAQARAAQSGRRRPLAEVRLMAPIPRPPEFIIAGVNYQDHIAEARDGRHVTPIGLDERLRNPTVKPEVPAVCNKQSSCVTGPTGAIHVPRISDQVDYEAELGFVIGRKARHVPRERAHEVIAGYLAVNDVSVRDWQFKSPTHTLGKSFETHGPMGPWIVTPDEIGDPHALAIRCWVNDELRQESNTRYLITDCYDLVATLSKIFTLLPGTVISTGTPAGVGIATDPPKFLQAGDVVRVEIEKIGSLVNRVIPEPELAA